jgi:hypothetical protein
MWRGLMSAFPFAGIIQIRFWGRQIQVCPLSLAYSRLPRGGAWTAHPLAGDRRERSAMSLPTGEKRVKRQFEPLGLCAPNRSG